MRRDEMRRDKIKKRDEAADSKYLSNLEKHKQNHDHDHERQIYSYI